MMGPNADERVRRYTGVGRFDLSLKWTCPFCMKINDKENKFCVQCGRSSVFRNSGATSDEELPKQKPRSRYDIALGKKEN